MSRHICFVCKCREADFEGMSGFTTLVWNDLFDWLEAVGIENPYRYLCVDGTARVDGGELLRWWEDALGRMRGAGDRLPVLYEIWREWPGPGQGMTATEAGYFVLLGEGYMTDTSYDRLFAVHLTPEVLEERRATLSYAPPVVEEVAPEVAAALPLEDKIELDADAFERIFRGTPIMLEHGRLPDFFARDFQELLTVFRHAAERGETVSLFEI
jgi:hypothetical protein